MEIVHLYVNSEPLCSGADSHRRGVPINNLLGTYIYTKSVNLFFFFSVIYKWPETFQGRSSKNKIASQRKTHTPQLFLYLK